MEILVEDELKRETENIQKLTDKYIEEVEKVCRSKRKTNNGNLI